MRLRKKPVEYCSSFSTGWKNHTGSLNPFLSVVIIPRITTDSIGLNGQNQDRSQSSVESVFVRCNTPQNQKQPSPTRAGASHDSQ